VVKLKFALSAALLLLPSCSQASSDPASGSRPEAVASPEIHPESGLEIIDLAVVHGRERHEFRVEVAGSRFEQARGLMFRRAMGKDEGMLFPMEPPREASFWMKNTVISLDIIFIGTDGRILNIAENAVPYSEEPRRAAGLAAAVLELNGGRAAELGIVPGDKVEW